MNLVIQTFVSFSVGAVFHLYTHHAIWKVWRFDKKGSNDFIIILYSVLYVLMTIIMDSFPQEDVIDFFNALFPNFVQLMGE